MPKTSLEPFRLMLRAALGEPLDAGDREPVFWSNAPGSTANEEAARAFCAEHPTSTILLIDTPAGRAVDTLISKYRPSQEQADVIWGLLSHRFASGAAGPAHAFVTGSPTSRVFRAVEARELGEAPTHHGVWLHDGANSRWIDRADMISTFAAQEGDFFVTRDPEEQLIIMEEVERFRPVRTRAP